MINIDLLLHKIHTIPHDHTLYLLEELPCGTGLFASDGDVLYIVPNDEQCKSMSIKTEYLGLETNVFLTAFNSSDATFDNGYYNSVKLQITDGQDEENNLNAFTNLCLAHASNLKGHEFLSFFDSLVSLFQLPKEQNYRNLIGLVGELFFIEFVHIHYSIDLSSFWHTEGPSSRLDFVCPFANFEIKCTANESMQFTIKHNQLFSNLSNTFLIAVSIEENNAGRTLDELIDSMKKDQSYCNSIDFAVNIEKEKRRISPAEIRNKHFIFKQLMVFNVNEINLFGIIPECIEDLSYKLDLHAFSGVALRSVFSDKLDYSSSN